jgi:SAM-dependent methyltransferase
MNLTDFTNNIIEFFQVLFLSDYNDWREAGKIQGLRKIEKQLWLQYSFKFSPLYIGLEKKRFKYPRNNFFYGEIPYSVARDISEIAGITRNDTVYDLGCGRGKFLFFINLYTGARCVGIDLLPTYINTALKIVDNLQMKNIEFFQEDILNVELNTASVVMLHGSTFSWELHDVIWGKIDQLKRGSRFITVSMGYEHPRLKLFRKKEYFFSWGKSTAFFYEVIDNNKTEEASEP